MQRKACDFDRWLAGMRRLQRARRWLSDAAPTASSEWSGSAPASRCGSARRGGECWHGRGASWASTRDGSFTIRDAKRAARSSLRRALEVLRRAGSGRRRWRYAAEVAVTWEQLELW